MCSDAAYYEIERHEMGPRKKKGFSQKTEEERSSYPKKENVKNRQEKADNSKNTSAKEAVNNDADKPQHFKESIIESNWGRYEEPEPDAHADVQRGNDFEVLLSYSSGAGSQLQLQEEREWDEFKFDSKNLVLDMNHLSSVLKCIPFHQRIDISDSVLTSMQIQNFVKCAEKNRALLTEETNVTDSLTNMKILKNLDEPLTEKGEYLIEDVLDEETVPLKIPPVHAETENLIESLSTCLSANPVAESFDAKTAEKDDDNTSATETDDLTYLLSLTSTSKVTETSSDSSKKLTKSNVDEWLSSILDE